MAQQSQEHPGGSEQARWEQVRSEQVGSEQYLCEKDWLSSLVETFENVSRGPVKSCDSATIAALKTRLARPVAATTVSLIALH